MRLFEMFFCINTNHDCCCLNFRLKHLINVEHRIEAVECKQLRATAGFDKTVIVQPANEIAALDGREATSDNNTRGPERSTIVMLWPHRVLISRSSARIRRLSTLGSENET